MPQYEPFEQYELPLPDWGLIVTLVKVGGENPGTYVVMAPLCEQLGDLDVQGQSRKLRADHNFGGFLRDVPYRIDRVGMRTALGVRRYKAGEWIHGNNPRKVKERYRDRMEELARVVTQTTDRSLFGKLATHLDPAPPPASAAPSATPPSGGLATASLILRGEFHFTCSHGVPHMIVVIVDENGPRVIEVREVEV
jgi:hypothetical protein